MGGGQASLGHPRGCLWVLGPEHPLAVLLSGLGAATALEHPWVSLEQPWVFLDIPGHRCMRVGEMEGFDPGSWDGP